MDATLAIRPKVPRYTGENFARDHPKIYRQVANLLAEGWSYRKITRQCRVHHKTVEAVKLRECAAIDTRKKYLTSMMANIATLAGTRVEEKIGKASTRDAIIGTGVAVDKMLALLGQSPVVQVANVIMPSDADREERRQLHDKLDAIARKLAE